ncbi:MAG: hypothetical protein LBN30_05595 [Oscillospiraceae bacterium]|jgi:hypothetical protein|nr:hypothetical protein [Oscillospiraceae bacterium]
MPSFLRKISLVIAAVVVIGLLVLFAMQFIGDGGEPATSPPPSATAPIEQTPPVTDGGTAAPEQSVAPGSSYAPIDEPAGRKVELRLPNRETLTFYYDDAQFAHEGTAVGDRFSTNAGAFLEVGFIAGGDVEMLIPAYLSEKLPNYNDMDRLGEVLVLNTVIVAEGVTASDGSGNYLEAWLSKRDGGVLAIISTYTTEQEADSVRAIIATMSIDK